MSQASSGGIRAASRSIEGTFVNHVPWKPVNLSPRRGNIASGMPRSCSRRCPSGTVMRAPILSEVAMSPRSRTMSSGRLPAPPAASPASSGAWRRGGGGGGGGTRGGGLLHGPQMLKGCAPWAAATAAALDTAAAMAGGGCGGLLSSRHSPTGGAARVICSRRRIVEPGGPGSAPAAGGAGGLEDLLACTTVGSPPIYSCCLERPLDSPTHVADWHTIHLGTACMPSSKAERVDGRREGGMG